MRILKGNELAGILVAPGDHLITDDEELLAVLAPLSGNFTTQEVVNVLNGAGYQVRGIYQSVLGMVSRERETKIGADGTWHAMSIVMDTIADGRPKPPTPQTRGRWSSFLRRFRWPFSKR